MDIPKIWTQLSEEWVITANGYIFGKKFSMNIANKYVYV